MNNSTVVLLSDCKNGLRRTYDDFTDNKFDVFDYNSVISDEIFQKARLAVFKLSEEMKVEIPYGLKKCRTVEEFIDFLVCDDSPFVENMPFISSLFNPFIDYVEMRNIDVKIIQVECDVPQELSYNHILEDIDKCEDRIGSGDYSGALTSGKSLIEGVCKEIIFNIEGEEVTGSLSLSALFSKVRTHLNLDPSNDSLQKPLRGVVSGLIQVVQGLNDVRNLSGDSHARKVKPSMHHALLVVNFLFHTYEYQRELGKIKVPNNQ